jgi:hypothetical protein
MLDNLTPAVRHAVIGLIAAVLAVVGERLPEIGDAFGAQLAASVPAGLAPIVGVLVTAAVLRLTTLTRAYGTGAAQRPAEHAIDDE